MQKAAMIMLYSGLRRGDLPALQYVKAHIQWMKEHVCNDPAAPVIEHFDSSAGIVHARVEIKKKQEAWQLICQAKGMKLKLLTQTSHMGNSF